MSADFRATIALTRYREPDSLVSEVIRCGCQQTGVTGEILFLDQQPGSRDFAVEHGNGNWTVLQVSCPDKGLSFARNLAIQMARHDYVLFLDADALAEPQWAFGLCNALSEPLVAVAGGRIEPIWSGGEPLFARSRIVRDQYSLLELGHATMEVSRVFGASMGIRRDVCSSEMYFDEGLGRREGRLVGGEDTDLCARVARAGGHVVYVGSAVVRHVIPAERERLAWMWKRLFYAGHGRAIRGGVPSPSRSPGMADWLLLPLTLPPYAAGWLWGRASRRST